MPSSKECYTLLSPLMSALLRSVLSLVEFTVSGCSDGTKVVLKRGGQVQQWPLAMITKWNLHVQRP